MNNTKGPPRKVGLVLRLFDSPSVLYVHRIGGFASFSYLKFALSVARSKSIRYLRHVACSNNISNLRSVYVQYNVSVRAIKRRRLAADPVSEYAIFAPRMGPAGDYRKMVRLYLFSKSYICDNSRPVRPIGARFDQMQFDLRVISPFVYRPPLPVRPCPQYLARLPCEMVSAQRHTFFSPSGFP